MKIERRALLRATLAASTIAAAARLGTAKGIGMTRYLSFRRPDGMPSFGRIEGETVSDLGALGAPAWMRDALADGLKQLPVTATYARSQLRLLPLIPNPPKIICIGLNYATHVAETGRDQKEHPAVFTRWADTLVAHGDPLIRPSESVRFDYEGELAVIIGKKGRRIPRARAMEHVAGYSIFNDVSVRDWQRHNIQFTPGKNFPATGAFGPELVTRDAIGDITALRVQTRLNEDIVQNQPVSDLIWDIPYLIEYCSTFTELLPGDVIATGTPGGVGDKRRPPLYMKAGDRVEVTIGDIGTLSNLVIDEA